MNSHSYIFFILNSYNFYFFLHYCCDQNSTEWINKSGGDREFLLWCGTLRIWCCCSCGTGHSYGVVCSCGSDLTPGLGTSLCSRCSHSKKEEVVTTGKLTLFQPLLQLRSNMNRMPAHWVPLSLPSWSKRKREEAQGRSALSLHYSHLVRADIQSDAVLPGDSSALINVPVVSLGRLCLLHSTPGFSIIPCRFPFWLSSSSTFQEAFLVSVPLSWLQASPLPMLVHRKHPWRLCIFKPWKDHRSHLFLFSHDSHQPACLSNETFLAADLSQESTPHQLQGTQVNSLSGFLGSLSHWAWIKMG